MNISILIATYRRNHLLYQTLESLSLLGTGSLNWEVLVVDNAGDEATRQVVQNFCGRLPVSYFVETRSGKNNALNKALEFAKGELYLFTDDDILADPGWLVETWEGTKRWPDYSVFGGRVLPKFPSGKIPISREHDFFATAYAVADWSMQEGEYRADRVFGPNMAVSSEIFRRGWRFNPEIGPNGSDYIMGGETELTKRLEKQGIRAIYLPKSLVYHQIRPEQLETKWLYGRAFRCGRSRAQVYGYPAVPYLFGIPRPLVRKLLKSGIKRILHCGDRRTAVDVGIEYWITKGKAYQYRKGLME